MVLQIFIVIIKNASLIRVDNMGILILVITLMLSPVGHMHMKNRGLYFSIRLTKSRKPWCGRSLPSLS